MERLVYTGAISILQNKSNGLMRYAKQACRISCAEEEEGAEEGKAWQKRQGFINIIIDTPRCASHTVSLCIKYPSSIHPACSVVQFRPEGNGNKKGESQMRCHNFFDLFNDYNLLESAF